MKVDQYTIFIDLEKATLMFTWKHKRPRRDKTILCNKTKVGGIVVIGFRLYYKAIIIKTVYY